jgi:hypothetical protein
VKKDADNTPKFNQGERVKVAAQEGQVESTMDDGRVTASSVCAFV